MKSLFLFLIAGVVVFDSFGQYVQVGSKLVGTGAAGGADQGSSISFSSSGQILAVGGLEDSSLVGAVWVYTLSGGNWSQMGHKLVGTGAVGKAFQGAAISLSSDGKTLAVGGRNDNNGIGAVWVYTLSGSNWLQVGSKLVGTGAGTGGQSQGASVSLSSDGKTLAVGGPLEGAVWVYTFSGSNWSQVGSKLSGTLNSYHGYSVSMSFNGKILAVGAMSYNNYTGAVWIYTLSGSNWSQMGQVLVGTGAVGVASQGYSVSLSSDGKTLAVGGTSDNSSVGAVWIYTLSGSNWSQAGSKLVGTGSVGASNQGKSVSLSSDGQTLAVGGNKDNSDAGAIWIFTSLGGNWSQVGSKLVGTGAVGTFSEQGTSVSISMDGKTVVEGGYLDDHYAGAVWFFNYSGIPTETANPQLITESANIYPNPFTHSITLSSEAEVPYTLYNLQGIPVEIGISSSPAIGSLPPPGVYLLKVNGSVSKVVKVGQ